MDEQELHRTLKELGDLLEGEPGPYILSDLRWNDGPLYVRYGAFARRYCTDPDGDRHVPAIEAPDGTMVPDRRGPVFHVPDWVQLPDFLVPQLAARSSLTLEGLPYRIEGVLHYSNGGGVYAGTDSRSGEQVVLKEARPYAGLAADGSDAVSRLEREKTALERLDGLSVAPSVLDWFTLGGHRFLVMEYLEGSPLNSFFARRHPLLRHAGRPARGTPLGVYDGLAGVAYVLDRLGHTDRAMSLILALLKKQWQQLPAPAPRHGGRRHLDRRPHHPRAGYLDDVRLLHPRQRSRQGDGLRSEPHRDCFRRGEGHPAPDTRPPPRAAN